MAATLDVALRLLTNKRIHEAQQPSNRGKEAGHGADWNTDLAPRKSLHSSYMENKKHNVQPPKFF